MRTGHRNSPQQNLWKRFCSTVLRVWRFPFLVYERVSVLLRVYQLVNDALERRSRERKRVKDSKQTNVKYVDVGGSSPRSLEGQRTGFFVRWRTVVVVALLMFAMSPPSPMGTGESSGIIVTSEGESKIERLPDGSVLAVEGGSRMRVKFSKHERVVVLLQGKVKFEVEADPAWPFTVRTSVLDAVAVGTAFTVGVDRQKEADDRVRVAVHHGIVEVRPNPGTTVATLEAGGIFDSQENGE